MASPSFSFRKDQRLNIELIIMENFKTMQQFAEYIGVSPGYFSSILNNRINAGTKTAHKISKGLNKEVQDLFEIKYLIES